MKRIMSAETAGKIVDGGICALLSAVFAGAALYGGYVPFTIGMVAAAGDSWKGFCALCGAAGGALLFLDFSHALRTIAVCVLLFTANNAFYDVKVYQKPWFRAVLTAGMMVSVEFVYVLRAGAQEIAGCILCLLIASAAAYCCEQTLKPDARKEKLAANLFVVIGLLMSVSSLETDNGFAPGRILAMLTVMLIVLERNRTEALCTAFCVGLAVDLISGGQSFVYAAAYSLSAIVMSFFCCGNRVRGALWFLVGTLLFSLPLYAQSGVLLLYEGLAAALCFLLLPAKILRGKREVAENETKEDAWSIRLKNSAAAFREMYDSVTHVPKSAEEAPAVVFDRAAEKVCRSCSLCNNCWEQDYSQTRAAFNDATGSLLKNGIAKGSDFPAHFADRCIRFPNLLEAINVELRDYLLRSSYRQKLGDVRQQAAGQYAQLSEILDSAAESAVQVSAAAVLMPYQIGIVLRPKKGERASGDSASVFEVGDRLCVILSDGMGSGEAAKKESQMAVRMLERFLRVGIDAPPALKTLNSALTLRAEATNSFTTVDLLVLSLSTGEAELYKYGAAPSYVKRRGRVKRINCSGLPAGIQKNTPEATRFHMERGSFLVMNTDGVVDAQEDEWLQNLLSGWDGENPQLLVSAILADSIERVGERDDAGIVILYLPSGAPDETEEV